MIHVEQLHKNFGPVRAVDGVSFDVARGEVVGLLGPNGAGKTTTMRIITGYLAAERGKVAVDGIPVEEGQIEARRRIGYLPENAPIYHDLEVTEYLNYIAKLRGVGAAERPSSIREMVDTCGLGQVMGRPIGELSKGYRQRVGLAAAMIHRPPILILDEPTSGLDPNQIVEIRGLIKEIGHERTVVLSTHILQEVEATCSRALIISSGKLVGEGTIEELLHRGGAHHASYTVAVRAGREAVERDIAGIAGLALGEWLSEPRDERQRFTLSGDGADRSEDIFKWAVGCGLVLSELKRESASLEEVFRELTQGT
ncbi:MAG: ATP-binding cassette domain-containing protein [Pseudomonadota bacterium]